MLSTGMILTGGLVAPVSEFADKLLQLILETVYKALYEGVGNSLTGLFDALNSELSSASRQITTGPRLWNSSAYTIVQTVAESVCIPIAAAFITVIFCWELIHLVQEKNSMQDVKPERLLLVLMKFALCLMVCAYSFKLVMGFCDVGMWAAGKLQTVTSTSLSVSMTPSLEDLGIEAEHNVYELGDIFELFGYFIIIKLAKLGVWICGVVVYIRVMIWFVEYLLYASTAPIPYSTWINKEWSQVGMNYTRKMLAKSFEGFFILLLFAIYGGVLGGLRQGDFRENLVMVLGCGFGLAVMMFKAGNISASIFNAH